MKIAKILSKTSNISIQKLAIKNAEFQFEVA